MGELVTIYRQSHLGGRLPAYDGRKSLYTAGPLPFTSMAFEITLQDEEDSLGGRQGGHRYAIMLCLYLEHMQNFVLTSVIFSN
jgi:eukaryotic translation initiation factor 2C